MPRAPGNLQQLANTGRRVDYCPMHEDVHVLRQRFQISGGLAQTLEKGEILSEKHKGVSRGTRKIEFNYTSLDPSTSNNRS
jgi:hypothetical protein